MGYQEAEIRTKSQGEIQGILKAYDRLHELAGNKGGKTFKIKRKKK